MAEAKPFASLSSGLLARKGAAKPAMRPQGFGSFGGSLEDLGWNDMGHLPEHVPTSIEALTPARGSHKAHHEAEAEFEASEPVVHEQQRAIEEHFAAEPEPAFEPEAEAEDEVEAAAPETAPEPEPEPEPEPVRAAPRPAPVVPIARRRAPASTPAKGKAAFTLRLDPERHLKLRLACAVTRRSAQQLVTGAVDDFLNSLPDVQALAERVPAEAGRRGR